MSSLHRLGSIALIAATLVGCSGEAEVEVDTDADTTVATPGAAGGTDTPGGPRAVLPQGTDSLGAVGGVQGPVERPVVSNDEQQRIDDWLVAFADSLNDYGDPEGTMYAGGTPLFNEVAGKPITKYEYIVHKHPEKPWNQPLPEGRPVKRDDPTTGGDTPKKDAGE